MGPMRDAQQAYCVMSHPYTRISSFENSLAKLQNRVPEICHFVLCIFYLECEKKESFVRFIALLCVSKHREGIYYVARVRAQSKEETHSSLLCG